MNSKWSREKVLAEARSRVAAMVVQTPDSIQKMLESLVAEAGWGADELLSVLTGDLIRRGTRPPPKMSGTMSRVTIPADGVQKKAAAGRR